MIQTNPFTHVETKVKKAFTELHEDKPENFYTREELILFLDKAKEHLNFKVYALFRLISFTGMRKGEALALTWNDINFVEGELSINKAVGRGKQAKLCLKTTKTGKLRVMKIDDTTLSILKEWNKLQKEQYIQLGINTFKKNQLMFSNTNNELIQPVPVQKWMYTLKHVSPHGLRHTHCSLLFEAGSYY